MSAASRPVVEEEARSWKNGYYFELGDQELRLIVWKAESIDDSYEFSDGKIRPYKPISNLLWKEMTRKKRQLQDIGNNVSCISSSVLTGLITILLISSIFFASSAL